jgi:lysozyme family protein
MADFNLVWKNVVKEEGGFNNASSDVGNYCDGKLIGTKYGVAATGYKEYYGKCPTVSDMKNMTEDEAKKIWKKIVWDRIQGDTLKSIGIADLLIDAAGGGKSGYLHARQAINKSLNKNAVAETDTMRITTQEANLINSIDERKYIDTFYGIRKRFFETHPQYATYGEGWLNRLYKSYNDALSYIKKVVSENKKTVAFTTVVGVTLIVLGVYFYIQKKKK